MDQAGSSRARRGGELRIEEPPPPAARLGCRGGECGGGGGGGQKVSAPAAIPFSRRRALLTSTIPPSPPAQRRGDQTPGASLLLTPRPLGEGRERPPRTLGGLTGLPSPPAPGVGSVRAGGSGSRPGKGPAAHASPGKSPRHPGAPVVVLAPAPAGARPLGSPGAGRARGRPRGCQWARANARGDRPSPSTRPGLAARARPGSYRGVSREAAAGALALPLVRSGLGASPAAGAQWRGARPGGPVGGGRWCAAGEGPGRSRRRDWGAAPPSLQTVMVMSGSV